MVRKSRTIQNQYSPDISAAARRILKQCAREAPIPVYREHDPVQFCHRYSDREDREIVALLAALMAFGRVEAFLPGLKSILHRMGPRPRRYLQGFHPRRDRAFFSSFRLRLWKGDCFRYLFANLRELLEEYGNLEEAFLSGGGAESPPPGGGGPDPGSSRHRARLTRFASLLTRVDPAAWTGASCPPAWYGNLVVDPSRGSACKRWNLFLRWVVRPADGVDLGLWGRSGRIAPRELIIPLDVHVGRISYLIGLRRRRTLDWKAAEEITGALARIDPADPLRFDLPLSHLGITRGCRGRYDARICGGCGLRKICREAGGGAREPVREEGKSSDK